MRKGVWEGGGVWGHFGRCGGSVWEGEVGGLLWRGEGHLGRRGAPGKRASAIWSLCSSGFLKHRSLQHLSPLWSWNKILTHH